MTDFVTPQDISRRTSSAVTAAAAAGRAHGLTVTNPQVLHDLFSVVVHLAPSPVVARIPLVLPFGDDLDSLTHRQQSELDVTGWLARRDVPVIPPSDLMPPHPIKRDGFSMTFWQYLEEDRSREPDYHRNSEMTADLHAAMHSYPGTLSFMSAADPRDTTDCLVALEKHPDLIDSSDLTRAQGQWNTLQPLVTSQSTFENTFAGANLQPIHGDSPPANIFQGMNKDFYSDFELVTLGPVEWDLAALGPSLEASYNRRASELGRDQLNENVMTFVNAVGMLRAIATLTAVPQLPQLKQLLEPAIDQWRTMPFRYGVEN